MLYLLLEEVNHVATWSIHDTEAYNHFLYCVHIFFTFMIQAVAIFVVRHAWQLPLLLPASFVDFVYLQRLETSIFFFSLKTLTAAFV